MKNLRILILSTSLLLILNGCGTLYNLTTYDKDGKIQTVESVNADIIGSVVQSTKNKITIVWGSGWAFYVSASPGTMQDPTPTGKIFGGKYDDGYISIPKDFPDVKGINWQGIAEVIASTNKSLSISATGANETNVPTVNK
jgi:hypothetical protein